MPSIKCAKFLLYTFQSRKTTKRMSCTRKQDCVFFGKFLTKANRVGIVLGGRLVIRCSAKGWKPLLSVPIYQLIVRRCCPLSLLLLDQGRMDDSLYLNPMFIPSIL